MNSSSSSSIEEVVKKVKSKLSKGSSKSSSSSEGGLMSQVTDLFTSSKGLWILAFVVLAAGVGYYWYSKRGTSQKQLTQDQQGHQVPLQGQAPQQQVNPGVKEIKLPKNYLADENGVPVILTPEILEQIRSQATQQGQNNQKGKSKKSKRRQQQELQEQSEEEYLEEFDEDVDEEEMEEIDDQLDEMNNLNIIPSNS